MATGRGKGLAQGERATPYRRTHLRLDTPDKVLVESPFCRSWFMDQISSGDDSKAVNVHFLKEVGWEITPYQVSQSTTRERSEGILGVLAPVADGGILQVGTGWVRRPLFRKPTDLPNALLDANANLVEQGDYFIERTVGAGVNWDDHVLVADEAAFAQPDVGLNNYQGVPNIKSDRVAVANQSFGPEADWVFRIDLTGNNRQNPDFVARFYFTGPPGYHQGRVVGPDTNANNLRRGGTGQYGIMVGGDGRAFLCEKCGGLGDDGLEWMVVWIFQYCPANMVSGRTHTFYIRNSRKIGGGPDKIYIRCENSSGGVQNLAMFGVTEKRAGPSLAVTETIYRVLGSSATSLVYPRPPGAPSVRHSPPRVDVRRDSRPKFQVSRPRRPATGTLKSNPFSLPFWPGNSTPLRIIWVADIPAGCTLTVQAYDARTDAALATTSPTGDHIGEFFHDFNITFGMDYFYVKFTFTSEEPDHYLSPTLKAFRAQKDGRIVASTATEVDLVPHVPGSTGVALGLLQRTFGPVLIQPAAGEPHQESGNTTVKDVIDSIDILRVRGQIPFILETEYDATPAHRSVLMEGYARNIQQSRKGGKKGASRAGNAAYPAEEWKEYHLQLFGKWQRLSEQFSNVKWNWHWPDPDGDGVTPFKGTDAIRTMLGWCGLDDDQIDVPDSPIRLWISDNEMDLFMEPGDPIMEMILKICREYLNAAICWDGNAGAAGMMRLVRANRPPYRRLCRLVTGPQPGMPAGTRLVHNLAGYGNWTDTDARSIPQVVIRKNSPRRTEPPEANCVLVTGVSLGDWSSYKRLSQWAINIKSFNFYSGADTADPEDADYLGYMKPLFVIDPGLNNARAVGWAARRLYDQACHAFVTESVSMPLVLVTDELDTLQRVPRRLQYYDAVAVGWDDDRTWLVRAPSIDYRKDFNQQQVLEIMRPMGVFAD